MELLDHLKNYTCSSEHNNSLHAHFTKMTEATECLYQHRLYIENNKLGFGDRAFHYMWSLLIDHLTKTKDVPSLLEIGVFKGQIISLWSLLGKYQNKKLAISCVTPLAGNTRSRSPVIFYWNYLTSAKFREDSRAGNFYDEENYLSIIANLFEAFKLNFNDVKVYNGYSTDKKILHQFNDSMFDLIYIDGDHTREVAEADIRNFTTKIFRGGFLVMDDASSNIPGGEDGQYWKGHQSVSEACEILPSLGFVNVLNVGHNRVYQKK